MLRNCRPICRCLPVAALLLAVSYSWAEEKNLAEQPGVLVREFVYETAPFPQCHASTVAQANEGTLVSAWFGGTREKHPDVGIWVSRRVEGKWTTPVEVANGVQDGGKRFPCWNPVLFQPSSGPLLLFYKVGPSPRDWWGLSISSTDGGKTWKKILHVDDKTGCVEVKMHPTKPDTLIVAMYERERDGFDSNDPAKRWGPGSGIYKTTDAGANWKRLQTGLPNELVQVIEGARPIESLV